jgi:hypothetical protein
MLAMCLEQTEENGEETKEQKKTFLFLIPFLPFPCAFRGVPLAYASVLRSSVHVQAISTSFMHPVLSS